MAVSARLFAQKGQLFSVIHTRLETGKHSDSVCQIAEVETHKENIAKLGSHTIFVLFCFCGREHFLFGDSVIGLAFCHMQ